MGSGIQNRILKSGIWNQWIHNGSTDMESGIDSVKSEIQDSLGLLYMVRFKEQKASVMQKINQSSAEYLIL